MNLTILQKCGGISLMAGALSLAVYSIAFSWLLPVKAMSEDFTVLILNPSWIWLASLAFLGVVLMIFGYVAVYSRLYSEAGFTGFFGFLFLETAYILQACKVTWEICLYPVIAQHPSAALLLREGIIRQDVLVGLFRSLATGTIFFGIVLFCLSLIRSREFPKLAGYFIFAGGLAYGLGPLISVWLSIGGILIHTVGCFLLGLRLLQKGNVYVFNFFKLG